MLVRGATRRHVRKSSVRPWALGHSDNRTPQSARFPAVFCSGCRRLWALRGAYLRPDRQPGLAALARDGAGSLLGECSGCPRRRAGCPRGGAALRDILRPGSGRDRHVNASVRGGLAACAQRDHDCEQQRCDGAQHGAEQPLLADGQAPPDTDRFGVPRRKNQHAPSLRPPPRRHAKLQRQRAAARDNEHRAVGRVQHRAGGPAQRDPAIRATLMRADDDQIDGSVV
jgi:hypothetical protein